MKETAIQESRAQTQEFFPVSVVSLIPVIEAYKREATQALIETLEPIFYLVVASGKPEKATALVALINKLTGQNIQLGENGRHESIHQVEPMNPSAFHVAWLKVLAKKRELQQNGNHDVSRTAVIGTDVNAWIYTGEEGFTQQHKLRRKYPEGNLPASEILAIRKRLIQRFCRPQTKDGKLRLIWDLGQFISNGYQFGQKVLVEIIAQPVEEELLELFFQQAIKNGLVLGSNLQMGALECLIVSGGIESIAVVPSKLLQQGYRLEQFRQQPPLRSGLDEQSLIAGSSLEILKECSQEPNVLTQVLTAIINNSIPFRSI